MLRHRVLSARQFLKVEKPFPDRWKLLSEGGGEGGSQGGERRGRCIKGKSSRLHLEKPTTYVDLDGVLG